MLAWAMFERLPVSTVVLSAPGLLRAGAGADALQLGVRPLSPLRAGLLAVQQSCRAPFSSAPTFSKGRQCVYVAGLRGQILCFKVPQDSDSPATAATNTLQPEVRERGLHSVLVLHALLDA